MTTYISPELASQFHKFGSHTFIQKGGHFEHPDQISLGNSVFMRAPYVFNTVSPRAENSPKIVIGDGCQFNLGVSVIADNHIELERNVLIGPNVTLTDTSNNNRVLSGHMRIGEGSWIGANAIVKGPLTIGKGAVVKPNSVVTSNVPDYCVVAGDPAQITQIYLPDIGHWVDIPPHSEAEHFVNYRKQHPLLSICIPTYNRASHLEHCLTSIFSQIGTCDLVEVIVSDNASTDSTPALMNRYLELYPNLTYICNEENIGPDRNIYHVMNQANGKFVKLQGDDDFYVDGTLMPLIHVLHMHGDCGVVHINVRNGNGRVQVHEGMSAFLELTSIYATFITSTILRREELKRIKDPAHFIDSSFNQVYLQYAILMENPKFCIMNANMYTYAGISSDSYNFGEIIFRSYQSILSYFIDKGLTIDQLRSEKKRTLYEYAIPWYRRIIETRMIANVERFEDIYTEHYQDEPYYHEALAIIRSIQSPTSNLIDGE
ncbi:glycosyltransferase [Paenibacillus oryzisoli]|uniref:Glycosyltransferase 2-like domain-containing protein n=1 Tax=Paenibacillus oryzisoli TaxID=1850517 RepID=A0A198ADC2_9BACL|nr:glycosyltransferase [Paenibacillus oryzisoli]OAS19056.1 hypothetical protein A8708_27410 [Paenibacillus oryzisoli]